MTNNHNNAKQKANDEKGQDVRSTNILAARAVADTVRTSLGPKGMDKMIQDPKGEVIISNDGATILAQMKLMHPTAKMMAELSKAQDVEAGDGTTSVVVIAGALLGAAERLLAKGIHPQTITESFLQAAEKADEVLTEMSIPVDLDNRDQLLQSASTSLNSKVVSQNADMLAPIAVDAVLKVIEPNATNVDLNNIRLVKKLGASMDETELVDGLVLTQKVAKAAGGPRRMENAKIVVVRDIERDDIEFISKTLGVEPVASIDSFTSEKLANAKLVHEEGMGGEGSVVRFTGLESSAGGCVSVLVRASNILLLD